MMTATCCDISTVGIPAPNERTGSFDYQWTVRPAPDINVVSLSHMACAVVKTMERLLPPNCSAMECSLMLMYPPLTDGPRTCSGFCSQALRCQCLHWLWLLHGTASQHPCSALQWQSACAQDSHLHDGTLELSAAPMRSEYDPFSGAEKKERVELWKGVMSRYVKTRDAACLVSHRCCPRSILGHGSRPSYRCPSAAHTQWASVRRCNISWPASSPSP